MLHQARLQNLGRVGGVGKMLQAKHSQSSQVGCRGKVGCKGAATSPPPPRTASISAAGNAPLKVIRQFHFRLIFRCDGLKSRRDFS